MCACVFVCVCLKISSSRKVGLARAEDGALSRIGEDCYFSKLSCNHGDKISYLLSAA